MKPASNIIICLLLAGTVLTACRPADLKGRSTAQPGNDIPPAGQAATMKTAWSYQTDGAVWGSPSLHNGVVFIGSDDGNLYALDAGNGKLKWKFSSQGIVRSRPAVANGLIYFTSDDGFLYALKPDGTQAWRADIGNFLDRSVREQLGTSPAPTGYDYVQSSPIVIDGTVYVGSEDGKVYCLAADSGQINWTFATGDRIRATPAFDQGTVYIGSWDKSMVAIDAKTGQARWASPIGGQVQSTAVVANGLVYSASRKASLVALDARTGEVKWEYSYGPNMWVESSPVLSSGVIYIGSSGSRFVLGLDALTGKPVTIYPSRDFHWSTPLIFRDRLYIGGTSFTPDHSGGLYSLKIVNGIFSVEPADRQVFALSESLEAEGNWFGVASSPVAQDDLIYFGGLDGKIYAVTSLP